MRNQHQADRQHPKTNHRKKPEQAANHAENAQGQPPTASRGVARPADGSAQASVRSNRSRGSSLRSSITLNKGCRRCDVPLAPIANWVTGKTIRIAQSDSLLGPHKNLSAPLSPNFREAPMLVPSPNDKIWYLYYEQYPGVSYGL